MEGREIGIKLGEIREELGLRKDQLVRREAIRRVRERYSHEANFNPDDHLLEINREHIVVYRECKEGRWPYNEMELHAFGRRRES